MLKNCPSCGRPVEFDEKYARVVSCPYCNSILEFWSWEFNKLWDQTEFIEFPGVFTVWKTVEWKGHQVYVKWQIRYEYDWWFFDDFFVIIDWTEYYLREDDGSVKLIKIWEWKTSSISLLDKPVGWNLSLWWKELFIEESWVFKLMNIKWFVNAKLIPGKEYEYLNWVSEWKTYFLEKVIWEDSVRVNLEILE